MTKLDGEVRLWVDGKPVGGNGIGKPICVGCQQELGTGFEFRGNGAVCRDCMDEVRNELWRQMGNLISKKE